MKLSIFPCLCLLAQGVFQHVVADGDGGLPACDVSQCKEESKKLLELMKNTPMKEKVCTIPATATANDNDYQYDFENTKANPWIEVDLGHPEVVAGVVQVYIGAANWAYFSRDWGTSCKVSCGNTASTITTITEHGQDKVFNCNTAKIVLKFPQVMTCRYIRIYPQNAFMYLRFESVRLDSIRGICKDIY